MNVVIWWFALMFVAWAVTAVVLWKTNIVVQDEERESRG